MATPTDSPNLTAATPDGRPPLNRSSSSLSGLVNRFDRAGEDWGEFSVLLDVVETFFDSRLDLWERRLKEQSARLRRRAGDLLPRGLRTPGGGILVLDDSEEDAAATGLTKKQRYKQDMEREMSRLKVKLAGKVAGLSESWHDTKIVRTREKISFLFGVSTLAFTCLIYGMAPEWIPFAYTVQCMFYLPVRAFTYKRKGFHYFLFVRGVLGAVTTNVSMCYFVNVLDLIWLWLMPSSTVLFICCYLLTMGPLASAIITWRNSLVFHSLDKVTSLFIHIYPPIVFSVILFTYKGGSDRYPAIKHIDDYSWWVKILMAAVPYCIWQGSYWKFISHDRREKIESGQRQTSFHYLLNDKHGPIGRTLRKVPAAHREDWFMFGQLIYSLIFMVPASTVFIHSKTATNIALIVIFLVSVWNGASFYVEVFGRKFERELERLRKELDAATSGGSQTSGRTPSMPGTPMDVPAAVDDSLNDSPLVLPKSESEAIEPPAMDLGAAHLKQE